MADSDQEKDIAQLATERAKAVYTESERKRQEALSWCQRVRGQIKERRETAQKMWRERVIESRSEE